MTGWLIAWSGRREKLLLTGSKVWASLWCARSRWRMGFKWRGEKNAASIKRNQSPERDRGASLSARRRLFWLMSVCVFNKAQFARNEQSGCEIVYSLSPAGRTDPPARQTNSQSGWPAFISHSHFCGRPRLKGNTARGKISMSWLLLLLWWLWKKKFSAWHAFQESDWWVMICFRFILSRFMIKV